MAQGLDFFDREENQYDRIEENLDVPDFLRQEKNRERFAYMLDRDPRDANFKDYAEMLGGNGA